MDWNWFLLGAGLVLVLLVVYRILRVLYNILVPYVLLQPVDLKRKAGASWAVVTGATDGIGKSYSFELAKRGFNIYLVSRTKSKLERTRQDILEKHPDVEVRMATFDFTNPSADDYKTLLNTLNEVNIGVLINNVGMFYEYPEVLHSVEGGIEKLANVAVVNNLPPTLLSAGILPQMVSRRAGVIVNISSAAGIFPMARWTVYSASKKYVSWLTATLRKEYEHFGIIFQTITPFKVSTKMAGNPDVSFFCPDSDSFAKSALNTIGNASETTGYITHQLECEMVKLLPEFILDSAVARTNTRLKDAALSKKETEDKMLS